jgi:hypothetical protein
LREDRMKKSYSCKKKLLVDYLNDAELDSELKLTSNGILSFHWSNWKESRSYVRKQFDYKVCSKESCERFSDLNSSLDYLKSKTIWLKNKYQSKQTTLYELYRSYLDPRIRMTWFDKKEEILVSTHTESGPYTTLTSMRWLDKETYTTFVRRKIIMGHVPRRSFRVGLNIPMKACFDNSPLNHSDIVIHQATNDGMILKFQRSSDVNKAKNSEILNLSVNLEPLLELEKRGFKEIIKSLSHLDISDFDNESYNISINTDVFEKYGNKESLKAYDGKQFYIFIKYSDLNNDNNENKIELCLKNIVTKVEEQFQAELSAA